MLIIPGSGPTDRDGNNPLGVTAAPYRLLAEALAASAASASVRIDKRGMFGSKAAIPDANKVTIADYAADAHAWVASIRAGRPAPNASGCSAIAKAALVALAAAPAARRHLRRDLRRRHGPQARRGDARAIARQPGQRADPRTGAEQAIDTLEAGKTVDAPALPAPLHRCSMPRSSPSSDRPAGAGSAALAASLKLPLLIVQGDPGPAGHRAGCAQALAAAQPKAKLVVVPGVNHVLKAPSGDDRAATWRPMPIRRCRLRRRWSRPSRAS